MESLQTMKSPFDTGTRLGHSVPPAISLLQAAAVNGDKSALAKLLQSKTEDVNAGDQFGRTALMYCVLADRIECAELLLKAGADVNKKDRGGRTVLHWAAHKGHYRCQKLLLSKGASWKEKDNEGETALHLSTRHKSSKCLASLLKQLQPGEVDDQDNNKRTALHWSSSYGHLEHIKMLMKQDSNIGIPDIEGKTPLHWAANSRSPQAVHCVNLLLETAPSVINWQDYEGRTALHLAVADGNQTVVTALIALEKCNVSALDNMFRTPLHWAAVLGHSKICYLLLDKGADYSCSDSNGATPLHYAAQNNHAETVQVFVSRIGVSDELDMEGRSAFMWAAGKGADEAIRIWVKHGVDIHQVDKNGGTAIHAAALAGHASTIKLLLDFGAQMNARDSLRHTPLFRACEMGHADVVQALIDCGAQVDIVDQDGRTPLHWAALGGHACICQNLIKFGIDPNVRDYSGRTPLQCAAYGGYVNCMSVLIEHKADPNGQDNEGMTALHWACSKGHLDAVKLLFEFRVFPNHMEITEDRYTSLDYALMGEHHDVAQFMIEQGALSITGIQDIAACKIQATFRGHRVRRTFLENKKLLMKHEQLRKDAAKKRAEEECKKKEDSIKQRYEIDVSSIPSTPLDSAGPPLVTSPKSTPSTQINGEKVIYPDTQTKPVSNTDEDRPTNLQSHRDHRRIITQERSRVAMHKRKYQAAVTIQRAWRRYFLRKQRQQSAPSKRLEKPRKKRSHQVAYNEQEWKRQIAALTIQLAWRKFYRKKLLKSLTPKKKKILYMWDPSVIAVKQKALIAQIYTEQIDVRDWHPRLHPPVRPPWARRIPSAAAVSYNFAVDQYQGNPNKPNTDRSASPGGSTQYPSPSPSHNVNLLGLSEDLNCHLKLSDGFQPHHFSYNMYEY